MDHGIRNPRSTQEQRPVSLAELIHEQVRRAIEVAVGEELAIALAARPYERTGHRRGARNGRKVRTVTGPTGPLPLTLPRVSTYPVEDGLVASLPRPGGNITGQRTSSAWDFPSTARTTVSESHREHGHSQRGVATR